MNGAFQRQLSLVKVLSLDIFDTTLGRRCARPEDCFLLLEEELTKRYGKAFHGFATERAEADSLARRRAWDQRQAEEIQLPDIYRVLTESHPSWQLTVEDLVAMELDMEKRLLYPLPGARQMIAAAREEGKKVAFISDMYLPQTFCEDRLAELGFDDYDAFFLSSTVGVLKHSGKLFKHALRELDIAPEEMLHVGDNAHSDGEQATKLGIRTHIIPKAIDHLDRFPNNPLRETTKSTERSGRRSLMLGLSARGCHLELEHANPLWYRFGYQVGGPLVYGYLHHIINNVRNRGIDKVYFLSRDGYILKQAYEKLCPAGENCPQADYLYASRRALNFASITELDQKTEDWLAEGINLTVGQFLKRINLDPQAFTEEIVSAGFKGADHLVVGSLDYTNLRVLYRHLIPNIIETAARERETYLAYLGEKAVLQASPFVMVDVGWMTSIQHSFAKILHPVVPELRIEGYYLGSYPEAAARAGPLSRHLHYLMEYGQPTEALETIRHCVCLLEFFFAAPEHTFLHMREDPHKGFVPELAPFHENAADLDKLEHMHAGILEYVGEMADATGGKPVEIPPAEILRLLHRYIAEPTAEEASELGDLHYADGYGSYFHHTHMARPSGLKVLGLSKRKWKQEFKRCHWPKGYYMRLSPLEKAVFRLFQPAAKFSKPYG